MVVISTEGGTGITIAPQSFNPLVARFGTPAWSPDGSNLIFSVGDTVSNSGIYRVNADGSGLVRLTPSQGHAQYSRDGKLIVFASDTLRLMNADGSSERRLFLNNGDLPVLVRGADPTFAPDGSIYYTAVVEGTGNSSPQVRRINANRTEQRDVTTGTSSSIQPTVSPDGQRIAVVNTRQTSVPIPASTPVPVISDRSLVVFNSDGTNPQTIANGLLFEPSWSRSR